LKKELKRVTSLKIKMDHLI